MKKDFSIFTILGMLAIVFVTAVFSYTIGDCMADKEYPVMVNISTPTDEYIDYDLINKTIANCSTGSTYTAVDYIEYIEFYDVNTLLIYYHTKGMYSTETNEFVSEYDAYYGLKVTYSITSRSINEILKAEDSVFKNGWYSDYSDLTEESLAYLDCQEGQAQVCYNGSALSNIEKYKYAFDLGVYVYLDNYCYQYNLYYLTDSFMTRDELVDALSIMFTTGSHDEDILFNNVPSIKSYTLIDDVHVIY